MNRMSHAALLVATVLLIAAGAPKAAQEGKTTAAEERAIAAWIAKLRDKETNSRVQAACELAKLKTKAKAALPGLVDLLDDREPEVRLAAIHALIALGPEARTAAPRLVESFGDKEDRVTGAAFAAIRNKVIIEDVNERATLLKAGLKSKNARTRLWAVKGLEDIKYDLRQKWIEAVSPDLVDALKDKDMMVRREAAFTLAEIARTPETAPVLIEALKEKDAYGRITAERCLIRLGPNAKGVVKELIDLLKSKDAVNATLQPFSHHVSALIILGDIGPDAKDAVPSIADCLDSDDRNMRRLALHSLGKIGPNAKVAVPAIIKAQKDKDGQNRNQAIGILMLIITDKRERTPALMNSLSSDYKDVRILGIHYLGELGADAKVACSALTELVKDKDEQVRKSAGLALKKIDPEAALKAGIK